MLGSSRQIFYNKIVAVIILCCLGIIIYSNTFDCSFQFDDNMSIVENSIIRNLANLRVIWNYWPTRFITFLTFAFNYHYNELHVFGYHLFNLIVHIGSAILVFWLSNLTFSMPVVKKEIISENRFLFALFAALIFLSHPIQTQAVTYIYQRATSLAGFFYLLSLCLYVKSRLLEVSNDFVSKSRFFYVFALFIGIIATVTKEHTFTLPLAIILYEFCFLKSGKQIKWKNIIPFLIIASIIPFLLFFSKLATFADVQRFMEEPLTAGHYFLTQLRVMVTYIRLLFVPLNQNIDYDYPITKSLMELPCIASLLLLIFILLAAILISPRYRLVSFSIFWFFLTLLPESSVIPLKDVIFEHRLYLPMVGYSLFLVSAIYYLFGKNTIKRMVIILLMIVTCYSILTYTRNFVWRDEFTLWNDAIRKSPQKARPYNSRGIAYVNKGNFGQALADFNKAIRLNPNYAEAHNNRGIIYANEGNLRQSLSDLNKAVQLNPNFSVAYYNLALAHYYKKQYELAIKHCDKAIELGIKIDPEFLKQLKNRRVGD